MYYQLKVNKTIKKMNLNLYWQRSLNSLQGAMLVAVQGIHLQKRKKNLSLEDWRAWVAHLTFQHVWKALYCRFSSLLRPQAEYPRSSLKFWRRIQRPDSEAVVQVSFSVTISHQTHQTKRRLTQVWVWVLQNIKLLRSVSVRKSPKMSHLKVPILAFSSNFCPIKIDLSGNTT